tara:strand:- start:1655 stop:2653 length:999 start_codon:yes stop_codon:yes gene_type:complete
MIVKEEKEGKMAKYDAKEIAEDSLDVFKMIDVDMDLPEWLEAKITKAADYMNSVKDYLTHHMQVNENVKDEMKKIYQLLIQFGNSAKDASDMIKKNYKYVAKTYRNSTPRGKAVALVGLQAIGESVNEYTYGVGDIVKDVNPTCPHYGAVGKVKSVKPKSVVFIVMNKGKNFKPGDMLDKTHDQMVKVESVNEARGTCWVGYQQVGMKKKGNKMVPNCVKEITELYYEVDGKGYGYTFENIKHPSLNEAEYQGRKVKLNKIMQGDVKKFKVYVKNPKGNVVKVNFGHGGPGKGQGMRIRKSNPKARAAFRARHNCDNPGPKHKARYWSCRKW